MLHNNNMLQTYSKQRQKSALVKHYHQQQLKRLQKKLTQIKHRKKGLLPENKQNSLPILPPRYILPLTRQQEINQQNHRLSYRIAQMKIKDSEYFRRILKQKEKINNYEYNQKNKKSSKKVRLIYSTNNSHLMLVGNHANLSRQDNHISKSITRGALTQRVKKVQRRMIV